MKTLVSVLVLSLSVAQAQEPRVRTEGGKVTASRGSLSLVFDQAGKGFLSSAGLGGKQVVAPAEAGGLFASLVRSSDGDRPLGPLRGAEVPGRVTVDRVAAAGEDAVEIHGHLVFADLGQAPFRVRIVVPADGPALAASIELTIPEAARKAHLTSLGLALPLSLAFHPTSDGKVKTDRKTIAAAILPRAGTDIPEVRWLVARQNDKSVWGHMLWQLAGVRQVTAGSCEVWEAWSRVNPPFILQHNRAHPGWMAVADGQFAVAGAMAGMDKIAPKEIYVDGQAKVLRLCFQSPYARPLELRSAPETLRAGPVYVFIEPAEENTRTAQAYGEAKKRPALARVGETVAKLAPTLCNFAAPGEQVIPPARPAQPPLEPTDADFASHEPGSMTEIPIWVDEPNGVDLDAWPITRGVPLRRGVLRDPKQAALLGADGKAIPCATRAVAWWPDKSVKWLLLDFQTPLAARKGTRLTLVVGDKTVPAPVRNPLAVSKSDHSVSVDTGNLKLTLAGDGGKPMLSVGLDRNHDGKVGQDETIIAPGGGFLGCSFNHLGDSAAYASGTWLVPGQEDPGEAEITELKVEEHSPLRAVILLRANLRHKLLASTIDPKHRPPDGTPVSVRFHLYAGSPLVRIQHTFMFAGDVNHDFLRQLGLRLPLPPGQEWHVTGGLSAAGLDLGSDGGVVQENPDSAFCWRAEVGRGKVVARSDRAEGGLTASGKEWSVTVGLRHMREMCPQEIEVARDGVWTHFYSPRAAPMDVRRYAFHYGDGESTSTGWGTAFGALRTHEAIWCFHADAGQRARSAVKAALNPPLARVRPRYVADTLAVGHVAEHGSPANDRHWDAVLYHLPRMHRHNRDFWRWMGFWDFGDEVQVYDAARRRWALDDGRYGWYNNEPLRDLNYHLAFLMTGNRRMWETGEAMSRHVFEVDVRHANPQPFMGATARLAEQKYGNSTTSGIDICGRRHNCQHWADGYFGHRVGSPAGFRLAFYQSGDPVMGEYMNRILAAALKTHRSQYMSADGEEAVLWAMIMGHEMTGEDKYLDRISAYAKLQVEFAQAHNGYPAAKSNWDWASNTAGAPPAEPNTDLWIWSFGGHLAMIEIADVYGDAALAKMLNDWALALEGQGPDRKRQEKWSNNIGACPLLAHYYRTTGDKRALDWLAQRAKGFHSGIPKDAPAEDLPGGTMETVLPAYTPNDGYGWVYTTPTFWYVGIPAWQGALRAQAGK